MRKPIALGVATLAAALSFGIAACGSSDDSSLSNEELITQADAICKDYQDQFVAMQEKSGLNNQSSKKEVVAFISDDIVPLYERQVTELQGLEPNEDDAEAYNDIVDTLDSEVQTVSDDPEAALNEENPFAGATAKAKDFGLKVCGAGAS